MCITQKQMIGDAQVSAVKDYDLGLLDSCRIFITRKPSYLIK